MKIEMHAHTSETSPCGRVPARKMIKAYADAGYDAVLVTDHIHRDVFHDFKVAPGRPQIDRYLLGYRAAVDAGRIHRIKVFLGAEVNLASHGPEDFLLIGIQEDFLYTYPDLYRYTQKELFKLCEKNNILLYQAHPFRSYCRPADPRYLHGVEIFNGNPRHVNNNELALAFAQKHGLLQTAGSDYHQVEDISSGIMLDQDVTDQIELAQILRNRSITTVK